ncbi:hypothetical protein KIN20_029248 [Parelaphostrongylus tenuis]|uniref:Uncharacterized protein n=1 Tax=Parelaphostrongylus tenuis TaxID=148309 RepID=A0AAD5R2A3_PARTN|nr:hypothetical protein KIN20_029248 [Parelaphostrongylus tenuis]
MDRSVDLKSPKVEMFIGEQFASGSKAAEKSPQVEGYDGDAFVPGSNPPDELSASVTPEVQPFWSHK